jgi:hypothetical protein
VPAISLALCDRTAIQLAPHFDKAECPVGSKADFGAIKDHVRKSLTSGHSKPNINRENTRKKPWRLSRFETYARIGRALDDPGRRLLVRGGRRLSLAIFGQASRDLGNPISGQHLGFIGLLGAVSLPDLLGKAFFRSFAILGSDSLRVDQLLSKGRSTNNDCCNNT